MSMMKLVDTYRTIDRTGVDQANAEDQGAVDAFYAWDEHERQLTPSAARGALVALGMSGLMGFLAYIGWKAAEWVWAWYRAGGMNQ
jgi:hypothetical protein